MANVTNMSNLELKLRTILNHRVTKIIPENIKSGVSIFNIVGNYTPSDVPIGPAFIFNTTDEMNNCTTKVTNDIGIIYNATANNLYGFYQYNGSSWNPLVTQLNATPTLIRNGINYIGQNSIRETGTNTSLVTSSMYNCSTATIISQGDLYINRILGLPIYNIDKILETGTTANLFQGYDYYELNYDFSNVHMINSSYMFASSKIMEITGINTSESEDTSGMFNYCQHLRTINGNLDISKSYNTSKMFSVCWCPIDLGKLNFTNTINCSEMFDSGVVYNIPETIEFGQYTNAFHMFRNCHGISDETIPNLNYNKLTNVCGIFGNCNLHKFPISNVNSLLSCVGLYSEYPSVTNFPDLDATNKSDLSLLFTNTIVSGQAIPNITNTDSVTNITNMFYNCNLTHTTVNLNMSNVEDATSLFQRTGLGNININLPNCIYFSSGFAQSNVTLEHLSNIYMPNLIYASNAFSYCPYFYVDNSPCNFFQNVKYFGSTFSECDGICNINNQFNLSSAETLYDTFFRCNNLLTAEIEAPNTLNTSYTFGHCKRITSIKLDAPNSRSIAYLAINTRYLVNVNLNLGSNLTNMAYAFNMCIRLKEPNIICTSEKISHMHYAFYNCGNLTTIPQFSSNKIINMYRMCYRCNNLSDASVQNIVNMCINSNIPSSSRKLSNLATASPFYGSNIDSSRYSNRLSDLTNAGWSY